MKPNLRLVLLVACFLSSTVAFGQTASFEGVQYSDENVRISTELIDCVSKNNGTAKQYVSITIENLQQEEVLISFGKEIWYDRQCANCSNMADEHKVELKLAGDSNTSGSCETSKELKVFSKMLRLKDVRQLTRFNLKDVNITSL